MAQPSKIKYPELQLLIGGKWISREGAPVINPADETVVGTVPHATRPISPPPLPPPRKASRSGGARRRPSAPRSS